MSSESVRRFWIEFDLPPFDDLVRERDARLVLYCGVGVTGFDLADCLWMVRDLRPFSFLPPVSKVVPDISLADFTPAAGLSLGVPVWRGVWYPAVNLGTSGTWRPRGAARAMDPSVWPPQSPVFNPSLTSENQPEKLSGIN
jgi:hypothetical protein